ncbi:hypothetical protein WI86_23575 [Burkholderia ubonensis]|nr:hypothetical protein WI86_23575 [Burkholderia ubonensis]KVU18603.1 hypothetical protein WK64_06880 [Burkholderia ubonensis]KVU27452.1 hypothetical protein WK65_08780 [Burkholderia ubonensis]
MRQIAGHMQEFRSLHGLDIAVPSFELLSERFRTLEVQVKQRCQRVIDCLSRGEAISLIVDSSGMKFGRASEWAWFKNRRFWVTLTSGYPPCTKTVLK